jgi:hypothetical protein
MTGANRKGIVSISLLGELIHLIPLLLLIAALFGLAFIEAKCPATPAERLARKGYRLLAVAFWPVALICGADFSLRQSIVLGLTLAWLAHVARNSVSKPALRFFPYRVWVRPNWFQILTDFKLIGTPEEWGPIQQSLSSSTDYRILRNGFSFTVVQDSGDFEGRLIYRNDHGTFRRQVDVWEDMTPITGEPVDDVILSRDFGRHPIFVMDSGYLELPSHVLTGYKLGFRVKKSWWTKVKHSCPPPFGEKEHESTGEVEITLAMISYSEFDTYWGLPENREGEAEYFFKTLPQMRKSRDKHREILAWSEEKHQGYFTPDGGWPVSLHHKYFEVEHRAI